MKNVVLFDLDDTLMVEFESAMQTFLEVAKYASPIIGVQPEIIVEKARENSRKEWYGLPTIEYCLRIGISSWEGLWANFGGDHPELMKLKEMASSYRRNSWLNTLREFDANDPDLAAELADQFYTKRREKKVQIPFARQIVETLHKSYRLGIITNGAPDLQSEKIQNSGFERYFEHIIISGEVDIAKPNPLIFNIALEKFDICACETVMVGDSISKDIVGAISVGIQPIFFNPNGKDVPPDMTNSVESISCLLQLPELLESME